jgi:hypothetical protein
MPTTIAELSAANLRSATSPSTGDSMFSRNAGSLNFISQKLDNVGATQNASSSFSAISIRHSEHLALVTLSIAKGPVTFRFSVISNEVRNPVISRFAIQDFTGCFEA